MKPRVLCFFVSTLALWAAGLLSGTALAQQPFEKKFEVAEESEVLVDLTASGPGTSWVEKGKEAAALILSLDGKYHQNLILFRGAQPYAYPLMLGRLAPGSHSIRVEWDKKQSSPHAPAPSVQDARFIFIGRNHPEFSALSMAPMIYARANTIGQFSDLPILAWYETERTGSGVSYKYSVIFTNEDGGTQTNALMARWGRTTDIEHIYEAKLDPKGKLISAIFQGKNHKELPFQGKKEAEHPLYLVATNNNMFADQGQSELRFALRPIPFDLSQASREEVMFENPWTYQIMAQEMQREGKFNEASRVGQQISDLRNYLYIMAGGSVQDSALSFAVRLKNDRKWYLSDGGVHYQKVDREGYFQTTIRLPAGTTLDNIDRLAVRCEITGDPRSWEEVNKVKDARCELKAMKRIFLLDRSYLPGPALPFDMQPMQLQFGDMVEIYEAKK
jgi:hypothetical protein